MKRHGEIGGDFLLGLKFVKPEILSTSFIDFLYDKLGELKSRTLGQNKEATEAVKSTLAIKNIQHFQKPEISSITLSSRAVLLLRSRLLMLLVSIRTVGERRGEEIVVLELGKD